MSVVDSARSLLFAPGWDERKLRRALDTEADIVIADLEDAVTEPEKDRARELVAQTLAGRPQNRPAAVRVNGSTTRWFEEDLRVAAGLDLAAIVLPKATPDAVAALGEIAVPVIALVESAEGIRLAYEIASHPSVQALALGAADLGAELWLEPRRDGQEVAFARSKLVYDSGAAGIRSPFDMVHLEVADDEGLEDASVLARSLGLRGKFCIHPRQVPIVNRTFAPTQDELSWAAEVVGAYGAESDRGRGALTVRGSLVDQALVRRAERILDLAGSGPVSR